MIIFNYDDGIVSLKTDLLCNVITIPPGYSNPVAQSEMAQGPQGAKDATKAGEADNVPDAKNKGVDPTNDKREIQKPTANIDAKSTAEILNAMGKTDGTLMSIVELMAMIIKMNREKKDMESKQMWSECQSLCANIQNQADNIRSNAWKNLAIGIVTSAVSVACGGFSLHAARTGLSKLNAAQKQAQSIVQKAEDGVAKSADKIANGANKVAEGANKTVENAKKVVEKGTEAVQKTVEKGVKETASAANKVADKTENVSKGVNEALKEAKREASEVVSNAIEEAKLGTQKWSAVGEIVGGISKAGQSLGEFMTARMEANNKEIDIQNEVIRTAIEALKKSIDDSRSIITNSQSQMNELLQSNRSSISKILG